MGYPMAGNVRRNMPATATLGIYDVNASLQTQFKTEFGHYGPIDVAQTPREAANEARTVISILPSAGIVKDVYLDDRKGVSGCSKDPNRLFLECSTIDSQTAKEVGLAVGDAGVGQYIDTPVSVRPTTSSFVENT